VETRLKILSLDGGNGLKEEPKQAQIAQLVERRPEEPRVGGSSPSLGTDAHFWSKVDRSGNCWLWTASKDQDGYGWYTPPGGRTTRAHRHSYCLAHGDIPKGQVVMHVCNTPACVRPEHVSEDGK
jgi:hypothetical protein